MSNVPIASFVYLPVFVVKISRLIIGSATFVIV